MCVGGLLGVKAFLFVRESKNTMRNRGVNKSIRFDCGNQKKESKGKSLISLRCEYA